MAASSVRILKLLAELLTEWRVPTDTEKAFLQSFNGFGADAAQILKDDTPEIAQSLAVICAKMNLDKAEVHRAFRQSVLTSFFTPSDLIGAIVDALPAKRYRNILEPSAGTGRIVDRLKDSAKANKHSVSITAIEKEPITSLIMRAIQRKDPAVKVVNTAYQEYSDDPFESYDLVISNIPFGDYQVFDPSFQSAEKQPFAKKIHTYYFAKSLEHLKDGGDMVFITTNGIMDTPGNENLRKYLMEQADLLSAFRLPNTTFKAAKTQVVSDVIFLRKNSQKKTLSKEDALFIQSRQKTFEDVTHHVNTYYEAFPEKILATPGIGYFHSRKQVTYGEKPALQVYAELKSQIKATFLRIDKQEIKRQVHEVIRESRYDFQKFKSSLLNKGYEIHLILAKNRLKQLRIETTTGEVKKGYILDNPSQFFSNLKNGKLTQSKRARQARQLDLFVPLPQKSKATQQTLKPIKPTVTEVPTKKEPVKKVGITQATGESREELLNQIISIHQQITAKDNNREGTDDLRQDLSDVFRKFRTRYDQPNSSKLNQALIEEKYGEQAYFLLTLTKDSDILFPKKRVIVQDAQEALEHTLATKGELNKQHLSALLPEQDWASICDDLIDFDLVYRDPTHEKNIILKEDYLSGHVVKKHQRAQEAFQRDKQYARNVSDLAAVLPPKLTIQEIDVNIGVRWIEDSVYNAFIKEKLGLNVRAKQVKGTDSFVFSCKPSDREVYDNSWEVGSYHVEKILDAAFSHLYPTISAKKKIGNQEVNVVNQEATRKLHTKIDFIHKEWGAFYTKNKRVREYIEERYNQIYNSEVQKKYVNPLSFDEVKHKIPYDYQEEATWRIINQNGGIVDHVVGAGKTMVMAMASYKMKKMGIAKKPMIIGMKSTLEDLSRSYKLHFPGARVLHLGENDFNKEKRKSMLGKMMNNAYDCIIMTHQQFMSIPQDHEIQKRLINEELAALDKELKNMRRETSDISLRVRKGLLKRQENLEGKRKKLLDKIKQAKDKQVPTFKALGVDHLFVDESQQFKNLSFVTRHSGVSGIGNPQGSQRAFNLLMACRTLQERHGGDQGVTFVSGTTISNSLTELYSLFRYLRPQKMRELKMDTFDAWATQFAKKSIDYELTITGDIKKKERFRSFVNVVELANIYTQISDVRTDKNIKLDKPKLLTELVSVKPSPEQQAYNEKLIGFAKAKSRYEIENHLQALLGREATKGDVDAKMLIATNLAKKMSIDLKLIDPEKYKDFVSPKLNTMTDKVAEFYKETNAHLGTQFIFSDIGTPKPKEEEFDVYHETKRLLIDKGVDPTKIAFIHDYNTNRQKEKLFQKVNAGEIRVVLGSTQKMGTGVNMQERCVAMHHVDIPWRPSDVEQRNGRGSRQGNIIAKEYLENKVPAYFYATERTLDAYQFELLNNKQKIISQVKDNSLGLRRIEEDSGESLDYAEYVAALTGNDDLLKLTKVRNSITELEARKKIHASNVQKIVEDIAKLGTRLTAHQSSLDRFTEEKETLEAAMKAQGVEKVSDIPLGMRVRNEELRFDKPAEKVTEYGENILAIAKKLNGQEYALQEYKIGGELGHLLILEKKESSIKLKLRSPGNLTYTLDTVANTPIKAGTFVKNTFKKIIERPERQAQVLKQTQEAYNFLLKQKADGNREFPKEAELQKLKKQEVEIEKRLSGEEAKQRKGEKRPSKGQKTAN